MGVCVLARLASSPRFTSSLVHGKRVALSMFRAVIPLTGSCSQ